VQFSTLIRVFWIVLSCASMVRAELRAEQVALVVNKNAPESMELARFYSQARNIPDDRIIELDLPFADQIAFDQYDPQVRDPLRKALRSRGLDQQVTCVVTFYGVPLRITARTATPGEVEEARQIHAELERVQSRLSSAISDLEALAKRADPGFQPIAPPTADGLARRADHASRAAQSAIDKTTDLEQRRALTTAMGQLSRALSTPSGDPPATSPSTQPVTGEFSTREAMRSTTRRQASPFAYEKLLQDQFAALTPEHTDSAVDSELALLWQDNYPRAGWQPNPLGYPFIAAPIKPRILMVMRLDGPTPQIVRNIIADAVTTERNGLRGKVVVDSRGLAPRKPDGSPDSFGEFDQRLRELADLVGRRRGIELVHDDKPDVLPPDSLSDAALYCGWYSVDKYVPAMKFVPGAVAFHVASYELVSLRDQTNNGWCRGLMNDGAAATLGAVSEPLLHSFPVPDDFFPLLMTGRLTLAEVYWRTCPLTSWKMCAIGDPLYTPYKQNPPLGVADLPLRLRPLFAGK
jgi:uncharacterized protein (TIGR03790 family)